MKGTSRRRVVVGYRKPDGHADDADGLHDGWRKQDDFDEHPIEHLSARPCIGHCCLCSGPWWRRAGGAGREHESCSVGYTLPLGAGCAELRRVRGYVLARWATA
jgi:hypothetical protein